MPRHRSAFPNYDVFLNQGLHCLLKYPFRDFLYIEGLYIGPGKQLIVALPKRVHYKSVLFCFSKLPSSICYFGSAGQKLRVLTTGKFLAINPFPINH